MNGNGEIEPEEWIKQCPCFDVAKEFKEFKNYKEFKDSGESTAQAENMDEHRVN